MFAVGDKIVHPMHGAGYVDSVVEKSVAGEKARYYIMKIANSGMVVMIPVDSCQTIGVRRIVSSEEALSIPDAFASLETGMTSNWNHRYRENMLKIKSGDLTQVAQVVKGLMERDMEKGLSTGERKMLHSAKQIFLSEIVMALSTTYEAVEERINLAISG